MRRLVLLALWACLWAASGALPALGAEILVRPDGSGDFSTIQQAVDAAASGDTVLLADGIYRGPGNRDLDLGGKPLTIRSQSGQAGDCVLDCQGTEEEPHRGFIFQSGEGPSTRLERITITGGNVLGESGGGGAIRMTAYSSPTLEGCILRGNTAASGGAVFLRGGCSPILSDCLILENQAVGLEGKGGGLSCSESCYPKLVGCTFAWNSAETLGGGLRAFDDSSPTILQCTFVNNEAMSKGGAVSCSRYSFPVIQNTILAYSRSGQAVHCSEGAVPVLSCCDIFGNVGGDWTECIASQLAFNGNLSADPLFCDLDADEWTVDEVSPCAPQGECAGIGAWPAACQGTVQFVRGDTDGNGVVDISDPIYSLVYQFAGGPPPACLDAADFDDSGTLDISDPLASLAFQFGGQSPPAGPYPACGTDPTLGDALRCSAYSPCSDRSAQPAASHAPSVGPVRFRLEPLAGEAPGRLVCRLMVDSPVPWLGAEILLDCGGWDLVETTASSGSQAPDFLSAWIDREEGLLRLGYLQDLETAGTRPAGGTEVAQVVLAPAQAGLDAPARSSLDAAPPIPRLRSGLLVGAGQERFELVATQTIPAGARGAVEGGGGLESGPSRPVRFFLANPYPAGGEIRLVLERPSERISVTLHDVSGRLVRLLHQGQASEALDLRWDGRNDQGHPAPAGLYFLRADSPEFSARRNVLLLP